VVPQPLGYQLASGLLYLLGSEVDLIRVMKSEPFLVFPKLEVPMTVEWLVNTVA
jgi:hypothetical protein